MITPKVKIDVFITTLSSDFSAYKFVPSDYFCWSSRDQAIYYDQEMAESKSGLEQLFHELGHATLGHTTFTSSIQLVKMESEAWQKAVQIAKAYDFIIDEGAIERSLNTYRDWLHRRSLCPKCDSTSLELDMNHYRCFNCSEQWKVPDDQRRRCYRKKYTKKDAA